LDVRFKNYRPSEVLSYLPIVERTDSHSIKFAGKDMIEVSKFFSPHRILWVRVDSPLARLQPTSYVTNSRGTQNRSNQ
jgi:hypothetical protein